MADRSIELLNTHLQIFNTSAGEYLQLVGDVLRTERVVAGDVTKQIKSLEIKGYTLANTDNYKLYWELNDAAGTRTLSFWKDAAKVTKVLEGSKVGDGTFVLAAIGGSGLSGTTKIEWTLNDVDVANIVYILNLEGYIKLNDMNTGAISNPLEYTRRLGDFLVEQLNISNALDSWLTYSGGTMYDVPRNAGESDIDYQIRIIAQTTAIKVTILSIRDMLENYGDNVVMIEGQAGGAYANVSYANCYTDFKITGFDIVKAAIATTSTLLFNFRAIMENVSASDYMLILSMIDNYKAGGVSYSVQID